MNGRGLVVAAVLLAALSGVVWWAKKHPAADSTLSSNSNIVKVADIPADQVQEVTIAKKGAPAITLAKQNGKWQITAPEKFAADQDAVSGLLTAVAPLNADSVVEEKAANLAQFGLNDPTLTVSLKRTNGHTETITLGSDAPALSLVYAQHDGGQKVYALATSVRSSFDKSVNDLRDKRLITLATDKLTGVDVFGRKGTFSFGKVNNDWQIVKPAAYRADTFQVEDLVRKLGDAKMDLSGSPEDAKKAAAAYATGEAVGAVKLTEPAGSQTLEIRKNKTDYYAKSTAVAGIYKVSSDLGTALEKGVDDYRNHKIFDFGFNDPNKIEFHNGSTVTVYEKSGSDWKSSGKAMDAGSVQTAIDDLRDLSATAFPATGPAAGDIQITVVSNDGKRTETASFAKSGDKYIARRNGENTFYELTAKSVDDAVKALSGIKPAASSGKKK